LLRSACCERHVQSAQYQLGQQVRAHGPTHHLAAEYIEHHGEVQESLPSGEWSERPGVVELSPGLSSPNRTCTFQRIRLSIQVSLIAKATSAYRDSINLRDSLRMR